MPNYKYLIVGGGMTVAVSAAKAGTCHSRTRANGRRSIPNRLPMGAVPLEEESEVFRRSIIVNSRGSVTTTSMRLAAGVPQPNVNA